ncbi:Eukaryotic protein of unknown function (DUF953) [Nesidiocoris tenuis]|uniref:Thioredoxin domain-containing protein 17 n=1 Tax=Nesidiocoris tenuis TaxID=355587 RepID=A0ABN7AYS9_9HEMI|nr:Eukaryotic protein of unknown function (DUF953) [Nesidiocoris tenuis]
MSVVKHQETDFTNVLNLAKSLNDSENHVYLLFMASRREDGVRWCPDCVKAEPIIDQHLEEAQLKKNVNLIVVDLEKTNLRDPSNPFATSDEFKLKKVPTLMEWKGEKQLIEEECWDKDLLKSLFKPVV